MNRFRKLIITMVFAVFLFALAACNGELVDREIEFQTTDDHLQWRYVDEEDWNNLIALDELEGPQGPQGPEGPQGPAGDDGQDGTDGTAGQDGVDGTDGTDGQDGVDGIDGQDGEDGIDGASAFDVYLDYYPGYEGTEADWIKDLAQGNLVVELTVLFLDGYTETKDLMMGELLDQSPYDADWYLEDDLADLADAAYITEDMTVYLNGSKYLHLNEVRHDDDGSDFNPDTGAYEPNEDHLPYGYLQFAANIITTAEGDFTIEFKDVTADVVIYEVSVPWMSESDRWDQVAYKYADNTAIPVGNELTFTLTLTTTDDTFEIVHEFEMTEEMYVNAMEQMSIEAVLAVADDEVVHTKGIVTQIIDTRTFFIEDETGAIAVYNAVDAIEDAALQVGDYIAVNGLRGTPWFGLKQITDSPTFVILESGVDLPAVIDMNAIDLTDDSAVEALYGYRIDLDNLLVVDEGSGTGSFNVTFMDPITEQTFDIRYNDSLDDADAAAHLASFVEGDAVNLRGVTISWFRGPQFAYTTDTEVVATTLPEAILNAYVDSSLELPETTMEDLDLITGFYVSGHDLTIAWSSNNTAVITDAGVVTQPASGEGHELVTMTATVTDGNGYSEVFTYDVLVYEDIGVVTWSYAENFDFVTSTSTSYATSIQHTDTNGFEWDLLGRAGGADGFGLGNESDGSFIEVVAQGGVGHIEFDAVRMFTNTNTRQVEVFVNEVSYGIYTIDPNSNDPQTFMVPYIEVEGEVTIRIESRSPGSRGAMDIQEIRWTTYSE